MGDTKSRHRIEVTASDKASSVFSGIEKNIGRLGALVGGAAIVGAFSRATKSAIDFEQGLAKTSTLLPPASRNMDQFAKGLERIRLSGVGGSLSELTEGLYQAVSAGVDAKNAVEFLDVAARAAKAGFTDTDTAIDGLTSVINAYGMSASDASKVADVFFVTQNRGKTTFGELSSSIGRVLPNAAALGVSFEQIGAALQTLTVGGISTNIAVTGLNAIIAGFIRQGDGAKLTTLGISGALQDLNKRTGGSTTEIQKYLGGIEALTPALALMRNGSSELNENLAATANAAGTAQDAFSAFTNTTQGGIDKLNATLEVFTEKVGSGLVDGIGDLANAASKNGDAFVKMGEGIGFALGKILEWGSQGVINSYTSLRNISSLVLDPVFGKPGQTPSPLQVPQGPPVNPAATFIGPLQVFPDKVDRAGRSAISLADALDRAKAAVRETYRSPYGESGPIDKALSSMHPSGRGVRDYRSPYGELSSTDMNLSRNYYDVIGQEDPTESLDKFMQKAQLVSSYVMSITSAFTNTIVRGIEQGTLRIKDLFNALKSAVLSILADIAARLAAAGILSLIFRMPFSSSSQVVGLGGFSGGSVNSFRPSPVGANPSTSSFGAGVTNHNYYIQGSLVTREEIAREVIQIGVTSAQRGQNKMGLSK